MSKAPRRRLAPRAPSAQDLEHRTTPGSYLRQEDGSFVRTDEATAPAEASAPAIPADSAQAMADALVEIGAEVPPHIQDALDAGEPAEPETLAEGAAGGPAAISE